MDKKRYYIVTFGCQMNLHESEKLGGIMEDLGFIEASSEIEADVIIFNTCCIRENAEERARGNIGALKKIKKIKPDLIIAVGGCMTQKKGAADELHKKFPYVDIIFGTHNLEGFKNLLLRKLNERKSVIEVLDKETEIIEGTSKHRTSYPNAWVNIMYGCNNFCTYCVVPYVRGRERSRKTSDIINECKQLIAEGYKEITLLGQNVNSYGNDLNDGSSFPKLLAEIGKIEGKFRLAFMTNHPKDFSPEMIKAIKETDKVVRHIHLPVQAGSNRILKLMNRHYTREDYLAQIKLLKEEIPDCAVTTDIMVGFPTETEEDFNDTFDLMQKAEFAGAFTFVYSPREGTSAAKMDGQIDEATSKERIMKLIDFQNALNRKQSKSYLNKTVEILCEDFDEKKKMYMGRDVYGRMAYFASDSNIIGDFVQVKILKTGGISLMGELVRG